MTKRDVIFAGSLIYAVMAVVTFGRAAAEYQRGLDRYCVASVPVAERRRECSDDGETPVSSGSFAGIFWPLYWSWEAFS